MVTTHGHARKTQKLWFCLTDSKGRAYKHMSAASIQMAPSDRIHHLVWKIQKRYSKILTRTRGARQLCVFPNRKSLAKRIGNQPSKKLELGPSFSLQGLGTNDDNEALMVVVGKVKSKRFPISEWFPLDVTPLEPAVTVTREEWMAMTYNETVSQLPLDEAMEVVFKFFETNFPVLIQPSFLQEQVFVRPCYEILFDLLVRDIQKGRHRILVTGEPGIGKSRFYAYCALRFSQEVLPRREVLPGEKSPKKNCLIVNAGNLFCLFKKNAFRLLSRTRLVEYQIQSNVIRLVDEHSDLLNGWSGVTILFATPRSGVDYRDFEKIIHSEYVLPPWTNQELPHRKSLG